jgi:rhamnogalacturonyl hydrolase YesR
MKSFFLLAGSLFMMGMVMAQPIKPVSVISDAEKQTAVMLTEIAALQAINNKSNLVSPRTLKNDSLKLVVAKDWTSGFFPGQLWFLYEFTGKDKWKTQAELFTKQIESQQYDTTSHDVGFKIYCSVGAAYRLTKNERYKPVIIQAATTLSKRYNPITRTIKSWDNTKKWSYPTIVDNMMNLELLFEATRLSGDSSFYRIAVNHANSTLKNHFRSDYSSYHVVDYDTVNPGKIIKKTTHQGYADESAWARGQAWALYGFTLCYRATKNKAYLQQAGHIAGYILNNPNLPKDLVPYWDFNAPGIPNEPRDVSAAVITASALYELSLYSRNKKYYTAKADAILKNITSSYRSPLGLNKGFLLLHSTGSKPGNSEIDVPINYADYYYLEALLRSKKIKEKKALFQ